VLFAEVPNVVLAINRALADNELVQCVIISNQ
jgi:hypothetical protein